MTPVPPSSRGGRRPENRRLLDAQRRFPQSLFAPSEAARLDDKTKGKGASVPGGALPSEDVVALMLDALELVGTERVLESGSATAYPAALLSELADEVYSVVRTPELAHQREGELLALGCRNVHAVHAEAHRGWPMAAPYQAIVVGAGATRVPAELIDQLDIGGRLVIPVGDANGQLLERLRKRAAAVDSETLGPCRLGMLPGPRRVPSPFPWTRPPRT